MYILKFMNRTVLFFIRILLACATLRLSLDKLHDVILIVLFNVFIINCNMGIIQ